MDSSAVFGSEYKDSEQTLDLTFYSNQKQPPIKFDASVLPMGVTIMNKDKVVYRDEFKIDAESKDEIPY
jgi:hypothetical protein